MTGLVLGLERDIDSEAGPRMFGQIIGGRIGDFARHSPLELDRKLRRREQKHPVAGNAEAVFLLVRQHDFRTDAGNAVVVGGFPCQLQGTARFRLGIGGKGDRGRHIRHERNAPVGERTAVVLDAHINRAGQSCLDLEGAARGLCR